MKNTANTVKSLAKKILNDVYMQLLEDNGNIVSDIDREVIGGAAKRQA